MSTFKLSTLAGLALGLTLQFAPIAMAAPKGAAGGSPQDDAAAALTSDETGGGKKKKIKITAPQAQPPATPSSPSASSPSCGIPFACNRGASRLDARK